MVVSACSGSCSPRIGLVLSGGGLRGAAHVGVLQQLVAHAIPIDVIVGASAGAVIAALRSVGLLEATVTDCLACMTSQDTKMQLSRGPT